MKFRNILLIDDDKDDREIFMKVIREISDQINCTALPAGDIALKQLTEKAIAPDAIFLDLNMPRVSGFDFLEHAKKIEALKDTPIIIYSTCADHEVILSQLSGASGVILKPDDYNDIKQALEKYIL